MNAMLPTIMLQEWMKDCEQYIQPKTKNPLQEPTGSLLLLPFYKSHASTSVLPTEPLKNTETSVSGVDSTEKQKKQKTLNYLNYHKFSLA